MQIVKIHGKFYFIFSLLLILFITGSVFIIFYQVIESAFFEEQNPFFNLATSRTFSLLVRSVLLGISVTVVTTVISLPLAYVFGNFQFPFKNTFFVLIFLPFFMPPYISAISWINLLDGNQLLGNLNLSIFGFWGSVFVLSSWLFPLSFFFFHSTIRINDELKKAASLTAGKLKIFSTITFPLVLPGLLAGVFFTFILAITNFGIPGALRLNVYPNEIFIQFGAFFNHVDAILLSFPLLILSSIFILFWIKKYSQQIKKIEQKNNNIITRKLNRNSIIALYILISIITCIVLVLPIISLIDGIGNMDVIIKAYSNASREIFNSIISSLFSAIILTVLGFYLAYFRRNLALQWLKAFIDLIIILLIAIPGTVYGIVLVSASGINFLSSPFSAVILSNLRFFPVSYFICVAGITRIPKPYLEAASLIEGKPFSMFQSILIPLSKNSILGSFMITFVFSFGELDSAIMVFPAGFETLPLRIYSLLHYGANEMVFALSLLQVVVIYIFSIIGFKWIYKSVRFYA